jgi:PAS domain S-box-containing protein/putative nucleotidyltransferase with HDIG domain
MLKNTENNSVIKIQSNGYAEQLQAIFQAFPDLLFCMDSDGTILEYRAGNPLLLYLSPEEFLGKRMQEVLPADVAQKYTDGIERLNHSNEVVSFEYWLHLTGVKHCFDARLVRLPGSHIVAVIRDITDQKRTEERLQHQLQRLAALRSIDAAISSSYDLNLTLFIILSQVTAQLKVDAADVLLTNATSQTLDYAGGRGFWTELLQHTHLKIGQGFAGRAALERRTIQIPDLSQVDAEFLHSPAFSHEGFKCYFGVPLIAKGQVRGVLEIFNRSTLRPDAEWLNFLETLAGQAAIAIDNSTILFELHQSNTELALAYDATIEGWSRALELRDRETEGHAQRVTKLTVQLARLMGMDEKQIVHVRRGALLHDIGKMGLPDNILFKPGPLATDELEIMQQHPVYAMKMLSTISYLRPALDIPVYHHEKWNGTGYPYALQEEQIPQAARIFAIADVYDALTSDRPYRSAWTHEEAISYIRSQAGRHFDPGTAHVALREIRASISRGV